jgi:hypothetical protein
VLEGTALAGKAQGLGEGVGCTASLGALDPVDCVVNPVDRHDSRRGGWCLFEVLQGQEGLGAALCRATLVCMCLAAVLAAMQLAAVAEGVLLTWAVGQGWHAHCVRCLLGCLYSHVSYSAGVLSVTRLWRHHNAVVVLLCRDTAWSTLLPRGSAVSVPWWHVSRFGSCGCWPHERSMQCSCQQPAP